jgi:plasmid maintenance system antidote protein VapI
VNREKSSRNWILRIHDILLSIDKITQFTPSVAIRLAEAFDTTPNLWLNLQQNYDIWVEENEKTHRPVTPLYSTARKIKPRPRKSKTLA